MGYRFPLFFVKIVPLHRAENLSLLLHVPLHQILVFPAIQTVPNTNYEKTLPLQQLKQMQKTVHFFLLSLHYLIGARNQNRDFLDFYIWHLHQQLFHLIS